MAQQLECRIVVTYGRQPGQKTGVGMYDPLSGRYEDLGSHGPGRREVEKVVSDLKASIERAGHRLTFCERTL